MDKQTLRKIGDEPVLLNPVQTKITMQQLTQLYKNKGYINASVDTTITYINKKAKVDYYIKSNTPYRLGRYDVQIDNELLTAIHWILPVR
jgi:outer membrane protein assembly factor BamA